MAFHSQVGQDRFIFERFFSDRNCGRFLDIGAHDGVRFSNTLFFEEELGWEGICIEPLPDVFGRLSANRKAICLNCCIADYEGTGDFLDVTGTGDVRMLSGLIDAYDPRHMAMIGGVSKGGKSLQLPVRRLSPILDKHGFMRSTIAPSTPKARNIRSSRPSTSVAIAFRCCRSKTTMPIRAFPP